MFFNAVKRKCANKEKEQNVDTDVSVFRVGFIESLQENRRRVEKEEHDEDNSSRECDDLIAAEASSNTLKKTE